MNLFLTLCGITFGATFIYLEYSLRRTRAFGFAICFPLFFFMVITATCLRYVKACCCNVFDITFIQQFGLDIDSLEIVDLKELSDSASEDIEMNVDAVASTDEI